MKLLTIALTGLLVTSNACAGWLTFGGKIHSDTTDTVTGVQSQQLVNVELGLTNEAVLRVGGDVVAMTNYVAALDAEALARASGDLVAMTNWQARVNALTNGAALGATALQPAATNGWTVGSHAGLATWRGATNAASDVVSSFAATGTVAHATSAARLAGSYSWQTVEHGTATVWRVSDDTTRVYIVSASVDFNGLAVGSVFDLTPVPLYFEHTPRPDVYVAWENEWFINDMDAENPLQWRASPAPAELPATLDAGSLNALGSCVIDYVPVTNSYALAITDDIVAHNTDETAHADIRQAIDGLTAAPEWIVITNLAASVTVTNSYERPVYLYATGTVAVAFSGLRTPMPLYLVLRGPDSLTFPGAYFIGGGTWQTNMSNHFVVWKYGTNLFVNPVTASED